MPYNCTQCGGTGRSGNYTCTGCGGTGTSQSQIDRRHNNNACFPAGTLVRTPSGNLLIENIEKDDEVLVQNDAGEIVVDKVVKLKVHSPKEIWAIAVSDEANTIRTTASHSFNTERGWLPASKLEPGMTLQRLNESNELYSLKIVSVINTKIREHVFNIYPRSNFKYFASDCLVHSFTNFRGARTLLRRVIGVGQITISAKETNRNTLLSNLPSKN